MNASIIPAPYRDDGTKAKMASYQKTFDSYDDLPAIIAEVSSIMGLRGSTTTAATSSFTSDILRIHVKGNTGLQLTVVDLPGLISVPTEEQTQEDVNTVHDLVDTYCRNPRTIILAVVQATNDIANQAIIQKSKSFDKEGARTVGIITKPDLVNKGTEARIVRLANNEDTTKLKHGFFILKNPSPAELDQGITTAQRLANERTFFGSAPWKNLSLKQDRVGVRTMQVFLQNLLSLHIEKELPKVKEEVSRMLQDSQRQLTDLGEERSTEAQIRTYMSRFAMRFYNLVTAAARGEYHSVDNKFFGGIQADQTAGDSSRLRAYVHTANQDYADDMRDNGHMLDVDDRDELKEEECSFDVVESDHSSSDLLAASSQQHISKTTMNKFVKDIYRKTRGMELPGTQNHVLMTELFHYQSKLWEEMAAEHVEAVTEAIEAFLRRAVDHISPNDNRLRASVFEQVQTALSQRKANAQTELDRLTLDKNNNIIKSRHAAFEEKIKTALNAAEQKKTLVDSNEEHVEYSAWEPDEITKQLQSHVNPSMEEQACATARESLAAYYKVARKAFVDNVCIQVIERHFMRDLGGLFSPEVVAAYSAEELFDLAGEDVFTQQKRKELPQLVTELKASLKDLKKQ